MDKFMIFQTTFYRSFIMTDILMIFADILNQNM